MKEIIGKKVKLRFIQQEDTENIINWRNKDFVRKNFIFQELFTKEIHENWLKTKVDTGEVAQFIIYQLEDNTPIGSVYLRDIDRVNKKAEYGIFIGEESALGKGFGSEVAKLTLNYAFEYLGLHKVMLRVFAYNIRAIQSYKNAGFVQEAYLSDEIRIDGKYHDMILMAKINTKEE